jgi:hypothetical protein
MSQPNINEKARAALLQYVGAVAEDQSTRVSDGLAAVRAALAEQDINKAREALRRTVEELILLGHVVDHTAYATRQPSLDWPLNRGVTKPLENLEADLGAPPQSGNPITDR